MLLLQLVIPYWEQFYLCFLKAFSFYPSCVWILLNFFLPCLLKDITMMSQTLERLFEQKVLAMPKEVSIKI